MFTMKQKLLAKLADIVHNYVPRYTGYDLDQAWHDGYRQDEEAVEEQIMGKDDFIERQGGLIVEMMGALTKCQGWHHMSPEGREALRTYV